MKWFKHEATARNDVKMRLLRRRFGVEGYGVYFTMLEIIAEYATEKNLNQGEWGYVDKYHTIDSLADEANIAPDRLREILKFCNEIDLLQKKEGRLYCSQILKRLDDYGTRILRQKQGGIKKVDEKTEAKSEQSSESVRSSNEQSSESVRSSNEQSSSRIEENRIEKNRKEKNRKRINSNSSGEKIENLSPETKKIEKEKKQEKNEVLKNSPVLPDDEKPVRVYERKPADKQTLLQRMVHKLEDELSTSIVTWGKQAKALDMMLKAGYNEKQISFTIEKMACDSFWIEQGGFDLMNVANNIAKYKAQAKRREVRVA